MIINDIKKAMFLLLVVYLKIDYVLLYFMSLISFDWFLIVKVHLIYGVYLLKYLILLLLFSCLRRHFVK